MRTYVLAAAIVSSLLAPAVAAPETARQILDRRKELENTDRHWDDRYQNLRLHIIGRGGGERQRELDLYERKYPNDDQKAILFFRAPAEVKGTGFLSFTHKNRPADQWLYLPALKRVRKITSSTRNENFVGTDLSYHDLDIIGAMSSWTEDDATSKLLGEENVRGVVCHVIELAPRRDDIDYARIVLWLGRDDLVPRRLEFYKEAATEGWLGRVLGGGADEKGPTRRIEQSDIRLAGKIPFAHKIDVETPSSATKTVIDITEVHFDQGLKDDFFSQRYLEREGN